MSVGPRLRPLLKPPAAAASARRATLVTALLSAALAALALAFILEWRGRGLEGELTRLRSVSALRADLAESRLAMERLATRGALAGAAAGEVWLPLERALRRSAALAARAAPAPLVSKTDSADGAGRLHRELQLFSEATLALQSEREAGIAQGPASVPYERAYGRLSVMAAGLVRATEAAASAYARVRMGGLALLGLAALLAVSALFAFRRFAAERMRAEAELRERDTQLIQAQKMEAVGRLAGGIAHDINNYLGAIRLNCDLVAKHPLSDDERVERMRGALAAVRRASTLISRLLAFGRRQPAQPEVLALNSVVLGLEKMLRQHLGERIELALRLAPDLWAIKIDPAQVEQILVNLLVNAREAMPSGGRLTVETANAGFAEADLRRAPPAPIHSPKHSPVHAPVHPPVQAPGDYVLLTVTDTGVGIPDEVIDQIFEPFFTTKEAGSGLGLATVYGLVKQNGGNVWADSTPGRGTTFRIYLPRCAESAPQVVARDTAIRPLAPAGGESILLVEDGDEMRDATRTLLTSAGFRVTAVASGAEALAALDTAPPIDLLLTDVVMRGMSGPEVAERVQALCGPLPVIFVSGYTESAVGQQGLPLAGARFLAKPYAADALLEAIHEALVASSA